MGKLKANKLNAFSLPETIVALVIILSVFATATMIVVGTGRTRLTIQQLGAANLLQLYSDRSRELKEFTTDSETVDGFHLHRDVGMYPGYDSLLRVHYSIYDGNNQLLSDWQSLVRTDE